VKSTSSGLFNNPNTATFSGCSFAGIGMTRKSRFNFLAAWALLLGLVTAGPVAAAGKTEEEIAKPATPAASAAPLVKSTKAARKAAPKAKLVDINSANKAALKKLPGITDGLAGKIIANRPYGSKTWLLSNKVIEAPAFYAIKPLIEAKQPLKTAAENAAFYEKMKKEKAAKP
jgi:23S rRNA G2445 N2-methylase RlmL